MRRLLLSLLLLPIVFAVGCGGKKDSEPDQAAPQAKTGEQKAEEPATGATTDGSEKPTAQASSGAGAPGAQAAEETGSLAYVDSMFTCGLVIRPKQILESEAGSMLAESILSIDGLEDPTVFAKGLGMEIQDVEQLAVLIDDDQLASMTGFDVVGENKELTAEVIYDQLGIVGFAVLDFHDVQTHFPENAGLSWRVRILPLLGEEELYKKFKLDEPWDSPANKALVNEMPSIFRSLGVTDPGRTSVHVLTNEGALYAGEGKKRAAEIADGAPNTIMAVHAGPETAQEWTKPGGLKVTPNNPRANLGTLTDGALPVVMFDGTVASLGKDVDDKTLTALISHKGGEQVDLFDVSGADIEPGSEGTPFVPTLIIRCAKPIDQQKAVSTFVAGLEPEVRQIEGRSYFDAAGLGIWFADDKTVVVSGTAALPAIMANSTKDSPLRRVMRDHAKTDVIAIVASPRLGEIVRTGMESTGMPVPAAVGEVKLAWQSVDITSAEKPLVETHLAVTNEVSGRGVVALLNGLMGGIKPQVESMAGPIVKDARFQQEGTDIFFRVAKPQDPVAVVRRLQAGIVSGQQAAAAARKRNSMRNLGLGFHNFHDVYQNFGTADGRYEEFRKPGLSWRVHLLPFLDEGELWQKFNHDEPWDSAHNKPLIEQMPDIFEVDGVEPGKTTIHVLLGPNTLFGDGKTLKGMDQCIDGLDHTVLAVRAGTSTAEIWTKPGGLMLDQDDPMSALGNIGETFEVLMVDGVVHKLSKSLRPELFRAMTTHAGREVIDLSILKGK